MDTLPLPHQADLAQLKARAEELVAAARSQEAGAVRAWTVAWLESIARASGVEITPFVRGSFDRAVARVEAGVRERLGECGAAGLSLADAQLFIANAHGFETWRELANHVEHAPGAGDPFEAAADAVVEGDLAMLERLVRANPELIRERSARAHRATLLHYVPANGVEDFRQRTPANAIDVARFLLEAGAEVDALANTYGGGQAQTTMNLLVSSTHPAAAGVQGALAELLLDSGAAIDGLENNGSPLMTALAFGYIETAETLARRGARIDNVVSAASLGRVDLVWGFAEDPTTVAPLRGLDWLGLSADPKVHFERAFTSACAFGRREVVALLLAHGVDPAAKDGYGMTGLHWAAANGHRSVVELLLQHGAPLEATNAEGQTVLRSTARFAQQYPADAAYYSAIIETLLRAGANPRAVAFPTGIEPVDEVLRRHGAS